MELEKIKPQVLNDQGIALIATGLAFLTGMDQWAWVAGISAERIWGTIEFYIL